MSNKITPACPSCGAIGVNCIEECQARFAGMLGREFTNPAFFKVHRLTIDAYSLQHPEQYMKSTKSAAAHLTGMCWSMEHGYSQHLPRTIKKWVDGARTCTRISPPLPLSRGEITLNHVIDISDPEQYFTAVTEWARSAWNAWRIHWPQARKWIEEAISESD